MSLKISLTDQEHIRHTYFEIFEPPQLDHFWQVLNFADRLNIPYVAEICVMDDELNCLLLILFVAEWLALFANEK